MIQPKEASRELHILTLYRISPDGAEVKEEMIGAFDDEQKAMNSSTEQPWDGQQRVFFRMESYGPNMIKRVLTRPIGWLWN